MNWAKSQVFLMKRLPSSTTLAPFEASLAMSCQKSLDHEVMFYNIVMWGTVSLGLVNLLLVRGWAQSWAQSWGLNLPTNTQVLGTVLCVSGLAKIIAAVLLLTALPLKCPPGCESDGSIGLLNLYPYIVIVVALVCLSRGMELRGMELRRSIVAVWSRGMELLPGRLPVSPIMHRQCSEEADAVAVSTQPVTSNIADSQRMSRQFTPLGVSFNTPTKLEEVKTPRTRSESPKMRSLIPKPVVAIVATPQSAGPPATSFETGAAKA